MNIGKTLFAQLMDFLPWKTFYRIVDCCDGDRYVKSMTCADQFRVMAFAQLTYRESLRDIEVCLSAQVAKLYHMGLRQEIERSTLADANEARDWRIHAEFAQRLIVQARKLCIGDSFGIELENTTYALDSTTIDLCLLLFYWALFRATKSAVKMHTLLDLRGNIPSFIHISDGKLGDVSVLDILVLEPGAIHVMDRGDLDFARLYLLHQAQAFSVTRAKSNTRLQRIYSAPVDRSTGLICIPHRESRLATLDGQQPNRELAAIDIHYLVTPPSALEMAGRGTVQYGRREGCSGFAASQGGIDRRRIRAIRGFPYAWQARRLYLLAKMRLLTWIVTPKRYSLASRAGVLMRLSVLWSVSSKAIRVGEDYAGRCSRAASRAIDRCSSRSYLTRWRCSGEHLTRCRLQMSFMRPGSRKVRFVNNGPSGPGMGVLEFGSVLCACV
jgi:hypothetical protein